MFCVVVVRGAETVSICKATSVAVGMAGLEIGVRPQLFFVFHQVGDEAILDQNLLSEQHWVCPLQGWSIKSP